MTNYQKGYAFERQVKKILESKGYYVMRSAGSHTVIDLIAFKEDDLLLIQLKSSANDKEPDVKQLLDSWTSISDRTIPNEIQYFITGKTTVKIKSNVKLLEELKVPLLLVGDLGMTARKLILWKGKGRQNIYQFEYLNSKWVLDNKHHILREYVIRGFK